MNKVKTLRASVVDVFVSHSAIDAPLAFLVIQILKKSLNLSSVRIRCTSVPGSKLNAGVTSSDQLRMEIKSAKTFIALITPNSVKSTYCLFEIGGRWNNGQSIVPLICSKKGARILKAPLNSLHALNGCSREDVFQFVNQVAKELNIEPELPYVYLDEVEELVKLSLLN